MNQFLESLYIVSGSDDHTIRIWDAKTGASVGSPLKGHTYCVWSVAYSPDGRSIISGSDDRTIRTWDPEVSTEESKLREWHTYPVQSIDTLLTYSTPSLVTQCTPNFLQSPTRMVGSGTQRVA